MSEEQPVNHEPRGPFVASFEGWTPDPHDLEQWPNSVRVGSVESYDSTFTGEVTDEDLKYADFGEVRHLVEIDTNYKPTRDGEHPVRLTRLTAADALGAMFPNELHEIASSDAYGALKYKVLHRCQRTGETPRQVLDTVGAGDRGFVGRANDPAAFLASRIGDER